MWSKKANIEAWGGHVQANPRPWQEVSAEIAIQTDSLRLTELAAELERALAQGQEKIGLGPKSK